MHSLVLAFSQHLVNILTSPSLTVPKVSPVTTEFSAISAGRLVLDPKEKQRVDYTDIFISPWCCDSSHEDRYEVLIEQISQLELDPTTVVLFSVMCLFHTAAGMELTARAGILSHQRKFSLLLQRYLLQSKGKEKTA